MARNYTLDTIRTTATALVILLHVSADYVVTARETSNFDSAFWVGNTVDAFSRICVPLFVLLSGRFLLGGTETFRQFYQKRLKRIAIPLATWTVIYLLFRVMTSIVEGEAIDFKSLAVSTAEGEPFYHMWYLFMLLGLYLVAPLISAAIPLVSRRSLWMVSAAFLVFGAINTGYDEYVGNTIPFILWFTNYLGYFLVGYLLKDSKAHLPALPLLAGYVVSSIAVAIFNHQALTAWDSLYFFEYLSPFVIVSSLCAYKALSQLELDQNILSKLSHLTLGVYLIHAGVLHTLLSVATRLDITALDNPTIGIPVKFIITALISVALAEVVHRTRFANKTI